MKRYMLQSFNLFSWRALNRWTCWFWTALNWLRHPFTAPIMGHEYIETESHEGCYVQVLRCACCAHLSIGWNIGPKNPANEELVQSEAK